jgi:acyl carrier protein
LGWYISQLVSRQSVQIRIGGSILPKNSYTFMEGFEMEIQTSEIVSEALGESAASGGSGISKDLPSIAEIQSWVVSYLADWLEVDPDEIDVSIPFDRYGLDSSAAVGMTGDLEDWLGREIDPTVLYDYPTIRGLAQHLGTTL